MLFVCSLLYTYYCDLYRKLVINFQIPKWYKTLFHILIVTYVEYALLVYLSSFSHSSYSSERTSEENKLLTSARRLSGESCSTTSPFLSTIIESDSRIVATRCWMKKHKNEIIIIFCYFSVIVYWIHNKTPIDFSHYWR